MMSVFSVTGERWNFSQMVFEDILEFLNDIHGSRENSSTQTNIFFFFYFPMNFDELPFSQCYTLQSMSDQCEKTEWLCSFDSQNQINHPCRALLCASLHYIPPEYFCLFVWWLFFYMIGQVMTWVFFQCLPARDLIWQQIHFCLVFIST